MYFLHHRSGIWACFSLLINEYLFRKAKSALLFASLLYIFEMLLTSPLLTAFLLKITDHHRRQQLCRLDWWQIRILRLELKEK